MPESLGSYVKRRLAEKGVESRTAAAAVGVTPTYLSRVTTGKVKRPGAGFCLKLAEFFGDPYITVLRLAGWIPDTDEVLRQEMHELAGTDPRINDLIRVYRDIASREMRDVLLAMVTAAAQVYEKNKGERQCREESRFS